MLHQLPNLCLQPLNLVLIFSDRVDEFLFLCEVLSFSLLITFEEQIGVIGWNLHKAHL